RRAAHAEAGYSNSRTIDRRASRNVFKCFESVNLTRKLRRVAKPPVEIDDQRSGHREFRFRFHLSVDERKFRQVFTAAMEPKQNRSCPIFARLPIIRHHESVGLNRTVDARYVPA